jgi:hypothetical protein
MFLQPSEVGFLKHLKDARVPVVEFELAGSRRTRALRKIMPVKPAICRLGLTNYTGILSRFHPGLIGGERKWTPEEDELASAQRRAAWRDLAGLGGTRTSPGNENGKHQAEANASYPTRQPRPCPLYGRRRDYLVCVTAATSAAATQRPSACTPISRNKNLIIMHARPPRA